MANLVLCKDCGAMRSSELPECFCGETASYPAPPPKPKDEDRLWKGQP